MLCAISADGIIFMSEENVLFMFKQGMFMQHAERCDANCVCWLSIYAKNDAVCAGASAE